MQDFNITEITHISQLTDEQLLALDEEEYAQEYRIAYTNRIRELRKSRAKVKLSIMHKQAKEQPVSADLILMYEQLTKQIKDLTARKNKVIKIINSNNYVCKSNYKPYEKRNIKTHDDLLAYYKKMNDRYKDAKKQKRDKAKAMILELKKLETTEEVDNGQ